jgi:hypothetical protein
VNPQDEALKKLMLHNIMKIDLDERVEPPMTLSEQRQFLDKFSDQDFLDEFYLAIVKNKEEQGRLFSKKSFEKFLHTLRLFVGGRLMAWFDKTQQSPEVMQVYIRVEHMTKAEYERRAREARKD